MPDDDSKQSDEIARKLASLSEREAKLRGTYDEHILYLRKIAKYCCSTEEQQRIVGDIDDIRIKIIRVEKEIWKLKYGD